MCQSERWNMATTCVCADDFVDEASGMLDRAQELRVYAVSDRKLRALFGVDSEIRAVIWDELDENRPRSGQTVHLLCSLMFLKVYGTEDVHSVIAGVDTKTLRKCTWHFLDPLSSLNVIRTFPLLALSCLTSQIRWDARLSEYIEIEGQYRAYASVDWADVLISEPFPFDTMCCSYKSSSAALQYEVSVSIEGKIVWIHGPFPAGSNSDLVIFRSALRQNLLHNELLIADSGYVDNSCTYICDDAISTANRVRA